MLRYRNSVKLEADEKRSRCLDSLQAEGCQTTEAAADLGSCVEVGVTTESVVAVPAAATALIFVQAYHNLPGISEGEWVDCYSSASINRLREDLKRYVEQHLALFSESCDYEEYFSLAEYDDPSDVLFEDELVVFRSVLSVEDRDLPFDELHPRDVLHGHRAVIFKRLETGDVPAIRSATELFNGIIECAIEAVDDRNPRCYIEIQNAKEFGPKFIDRLLGSIERVGQAWRQDAYDKFLGERFKALEPLLMHLRSTVQHEGWPHSDLSLGRLLLIVDYFKKVVEEDWQF